MIKGFSKVVVCDQLIPWYRLAYHSGVGKHGNKITPLIESKKQGRVGLPNIFDMNVPRNLKIPSHVPPLKVS